jgi:peptidyl-prolyl cis-trans isomerase SurA
MKSKTDRKHLKMRIKKIIILSALLVGGLMQAQDQEKVLFSIDGEDVYNAEFIRVFEKNKDILVDEQQKDFKEYFDLFVDFKLKLRQARDIGLDTSGAYIEELQKYREQLIQPYLQNPEATEGLIKEAYDRTIEEVRASHILIKLEENASPKDTLRAYQRILEARTSILAGVHFDSVAKTYSEDPSVKMNYGDLGYFSAFSMVYPFENAAYNTKVGEISSPFRTKFGYHILKVNDKRKSPGEVQVAHIMVKNDSLNADAAKQKIDDIYKKLEQGGDFATIAKDHSDDASSAQKGGVLPKFGTGRMIKPFEEVAFKLTEEGDFSKPFQSAYGWHILKLLKIYPVPSFADLHSRLEGKVKNSSRAGYVERSLAQKIAMDYTIETDRNKVYAFPGTAEMKNSHDTILSIEKKCFTANDLYEFSKQSKLRNIGELYEEFKNAMIIDYYKAHLDETSHEFALTYQEYRDGLLLFELLQKEIWERAEKDSLGLEQFFEQRRDQYVWKKRAAFTIASCTRKEKAEIVQEYMQQDLPVDSIKSLVNEGATIHVLFSKGKLEEGSLKLPLQYEFEQGVSEIFEEEKNNFTIIKASEIYEPQQKELMEARGEVMNDYQNYLEKLWVENLRNTYKVKLNHKNYRELKLRFSDKA